MFKKRLTLPLLTTAEGSHKAMSPSERWLFYLLSVVLVTSTLLLVAQVRMQTSVLVPSSGGRVTEGVIGAPRFVNPVLAISQTDKDLSELIYAGLTTRDTNGAIVPELAAHYKVSDDALTYTFTLQDNLTFHDGTPLTADDVVFTIEKTLQPDIKSPERANWEGVAVEKVDELTITFTLTKPYAQFLQNTLIGILPQEHWGELTADEFIFSRLNTAPIGSGPYKFVNALHNGSGIPSSFNLERFTQYVRGTPYIKKFAVNFYSSKDKMEEALTSSAVTSISEVLPQSVAKLHKQKNNAVYTATLPRIFAVFFNQGHNAVLESATVRKVLRDSVNKDALVQGVLNGYATAIHSPILTKTRQTDASQVTLSTEEARAKLEKDGWELNDKGIYAKDTLTLSLTLTTANSDELKEIANIIAKKWSELGVEVKIEVFEPGNLAQSVLRTRDYDALLFGEIVGTDPDPYAFWHSSQRSDPGLNIANYTNGTVDSLLIKARSTVKSDIRQEIYSEVATELHKDAPAIFLYAPHFIYITSKAVRGISFAPALEPHERFNNVHLWHINTGRNWQLFTQ